MSTKKESSNDGQSPIPFKQERLDDGLNYEEKTTFSDPLPKGIDSVSAESVSDEDGVAFSKNPFLDPDVAAHWTAVYEKSQYECRHVFDPNFTWTEEEERKIVRRLDWRVCLWAVSKIKIFTSFNH
jgi:hypothetical protein